VTIAQSEQHVATNVTCTMCACLCDDLRITHEAGRVIQAEGACSLAEPWYLKQGTIQPSIADVEGKPASLNDAIGRAASILHPAKAPLIYGLSRSSTAGQRAAVRLADILGATIDTTASLGHGPSVMAVQEEGESTCTLGEARNRADLVVFWGTNPAISHPRHFERYSVEPIGEFLPGGRQDRTVVVIDIQPTETSAVADLFLQVEPGKDFEAIWTLRMMLRGDVPDAAAVTGIPPQKLADLLDRMRRCKYGVIFFGFGLSRGRNGHNTVEALLKLVRDLNQYTRFSVRRMRGSGDVTGADMVLAWQTGYPFSVNLARGYPRYNPGEYSAQDVLERRETDACVLVGSHGIQRLSQAARSHLSEIPTIVLDSPVADVPIRPTVRFTTAIYGIHATGTAYRMDEVPLPLKAFLPSDYPTDADVLTEIRNSIQKQRPMNAPRPSLRVGRR
jgi:formylmethanofuran dehydrogenase subunit B